ncbi:unnamed protein product, partial [Prorocentrum cordatum]
MAAQRLRDQVEAVGRLLEAVQGQPCFDTVAAAQERMLVQAFGSARLQPTQVTTLSSLVAAQPWSEVSKGRLLEKLGSIVASGSAVGLRMAQQDYECIFGYLTAGSWHQLARTDVPEEAKLNVLVDVAISLSLRNPTEGTYHMLTAMWRMAVDGAEAAKNLARAAKYSYLQQTKRVFKRQVSRLPAPPVRLTELPTSPSTFCGNHPDFFKQVYGDELPAACPAPEAAIRSVQATYPCRNTKQQATGAQMMSASASQPDVLQMMQLMFDNLRRADVGAQTGPLNLKILGGGAKRAAASAFAAVE